MSQTPSLKFKVQSRNLEPIQFSGDVPAVVEIEVVLKISYAVFRVVPALLERKLLSKSFNCSQPLTLLKLLSAQSSALALQRRIIRAPFHRLTRRARWATCSKQFSMIFVLERLRANLW